MLVSFKAASVGLSSVACVAIILAFVKYTKTRPIFENISKLISQMWSHFTHEIPQNLELKCPNETAEPINKNANCAFNNIKMVRKAVYPYALAMSSAIIIMAVCGKIAKSPSLILQMSSVVGSFMFFGAALMAIGIFAYEPNKDIRETAIPKQYEYEPIVSIAGLTVVGLMVVSYVVNCGLSA